MFFKERLGAGEPLRGAINVMPSAVATQALATAGADFVLIDREHGPIGPESLHAMIAATAGSGCAALVRVPAIDEAEVKAALDAGAEGIFFPLVRTAADAERCVSFMRYPPHGVRGWGPFIAHSRFAAELTGYAPDVAPRLTCCVLLETAEAVEDADAILAVDGIDLAMIAPYDLSTALGVPGEFDAPVFADAVATLERAARSRGIPLAGVALTAERSATLLADGYRVLVQGIDVLMLKAAVRGWA